MNESSVKSPADARAAAATLFESRPPILVEVRFPGMGTSPDWHLLNDIDDLDNLSDRLGPGVELHLNSVWDLKNPKGTIRLAGGAA
ncbi:MAG: hypothetical protein U0746_07980 [Gemmataceae bacterium]